MESGMNRRRFIKASVAAAAAVTTVGAGAALLREKETPVISNPLPPRIQAPVQISPSSNEQSAEMFKRLASAEAENVRLQAQLNSAKRRLESKQNSIASQANSESESLLAQLDDMSLQVGVLSGLVALYNQLDHLDLDQVVTDGLAAVDTALDDLIEGLPTISEGIEMGQAALDDLEDQIPILEDGREWLEQQLADVDQYYSVIERALDRAVEGGGSFLNRLEEWFQGILKWLPFGIGRRAADVMEAISDLTSGIPDWLQGTDDKIAQPLAGLLEKKDGQPAVHRKIITPLRKGALEPAAKALDDTQNLKTTYSQYLAAPTRWNMERKQALLASIREYRETHQL
jgi:hypothetical protein